MTQADYIALDFGKLMLEKTALQAKVDDLERQLAEVRTLIPPSPALHLTEAAS